MSGKTIIFMAGGRGERFWPLSSTARPKHLLKLFEGKSLMELSVERVGALGADIKVITSRPQEALMRETLPGLMASSIVAEPEGRDTAAAVALAARLAQLENPQALMAMLPADQFIADREAFAKTLEQAFELAAKGESLVVVGIRPNHPATGYGYIQKGEALSLGWRVASFKEKPDEATARGYLNEGGYFWNAGMFVWSVSAIIKALSEFVPDIWGALEGIDPRDKAQLDRVYPSLRKISIDYAVMERAKNIAMVEGNFDWSDAGEWGSFAKLRPQDSAGNSSLGVVAATKCDNSLIVNEDSEHLVATFGLQDMVVVHTSKATLVMPKSRAAELKVLLKEVGSVEGLKKFLT